MKKSFGLVAALMFFVLVVIVAGCTNALRPEKTPQQIEAEKIINKIDSLPIYDEEGNITKPAGESSSSLSDTAPAVVAVETAPIVPDGKGAEPIPTPIPPAAHEEVRTVLVDQDYSGVASVKGIAWIKAIGAKKISGDSSFGRLEITLSRNGQNKSFDTLGLYFAPLDDRGIVAPALEWRHTRYIDAQHLHNTRALAASSGLSTLGVESITKTYDFSELPITKECNYNVSPAFCPEGTEYGNFLNVARDTSFFFGFLPSRTTAHVTVTLVHDGNLTVSEPFSR